MKLPALLKDKRVLIALAVLAVLVVASTLLATESFRQRYLWQVSSPTRNSSYDQRGEPVRLSIGGVGAFENAPVTDNYTNQRV